MCLLWSVFISTLIVSRHRQYTGRQCSLPLIMEIISLLLLLVRTQHNNATKKSLQAGTLQYVYRARAS